MTAARRVHIVVLALLLVLAAACTSARVVKSEVANEFVALGLRAAAINAAWHEAAPTLPSARIRAYNEYLARFKSEFHALRLRYDLSTTDQLPEILSAVRGMRRELEGWAKP